MVVEMDKVDRVDGQYKSKNKFFCLLILGIGFVSQAEECVKYIGKEKAMGTEFTFTLYGDKNRWGEEELRTVADEAFASIHSLEKRISEWIEGSITSEINRDAAIKPVSLDDDTLQLLLASKKVYEETEGVFDVTVGPLVKLWGFYRREGHLPTEAELAEAKALVGFQYVEIDETSATVRFTKPGIKLDFGGIGKGLAVDQAAAILRSKGIKNALLDSGKSSVLALGAPPGRDMWAIGIQDPKDKTKDIVDDIALGEESISTSGNYENFLVVDGKRYGHIFDPRTGMPVEGNVLSVSVIAPTGLETDGYDTALFILGEEKTRKFCEKHPEVRVIMVVSDGDGERVVRIGKF